LVGLFFFLLHPLCPPAAPPQLRRRNKAMAKKLGKSPVAKEEDKEGLFASCSFTDLGLHPTLCAHLQDKMGFQAPTRIQAQAIPVAMSGQHMLVKAATGTGKTLAYLAPIVHLLQMREPRVERTDGTFGNNNFL
jgi:ATP-dependent RNA helicase DDX31/DBP7